MDFRVGIEVGCVVHKDKIEEEKIKHDLGGQEELLRRLCPWLELWAGLGRGYLVLNIDKATGTQKGLFGK